MTRKSRREIELALDRLAGDAPDDIAVESEVVEITADDVDEDGAVNAPDVDVPDGSVAVDLAATSDAVTAYQIAPIDGARREERDE